MHTGYHPLVSDSRSFGLLALMEYPDASENTACGLCCPGAMDLPCEFE